MQKSGEEIGGPRLVFSLHITAMRKSPHHSYKKASLLCTRFPLRLLICSQISLYFHRSVSYLACDESMASTPPWVKALKPSGPQGSELLKQERDQSNVPVEKLSNFLFTKEVLDRQAEILDILKAEKVFDKSQNYFAGRVERFQTALARAKRLQQLTIKHQWTKDEYQMAAELISEPGPYGLHVSMFLVRPV